MNSEEMHVYNHTWIILKVFWCVIQQCINLARWTVQGCLTYRVLHSKRSFLGFNVFVIRLSQWFSVLSTHLHFIFDCKMRRTSLKILGNGLFYHDSCRSNDCCPRHCTLPSKAEWHRYSLQYKMENGHESNPSSKQ